MFFRAQHLALAALIFFLASCATYLRGWTDSVSPATDVQEQHQDALKSDSTSRAAPQAAPRKPLARFRLAANSEVDRKSLCQVKAKQYSSSSRRCIFIDTDGAKGAMTTEFQTYTAFSATRCSWEVWHFGEPSRVNSRALDKLKEQPGLKLRLQSRAARASGHNVRRKELSEYRWEHIGRKETDLARLMHANLDLQNDLITLGLHNDIRGAQTTFQLVESMVDVGVAAWVDKWLIDAGYLDHYEVNASLWQALERGVPGLRRFPFMKDQWKLVRAYHRATFMALPNRTKTEGVNNTIPEQRKVYLDFGMNHGDTIYMFLTYVLDPDNWDVWGFEAVPALADDAAVLFHWIEDHYPLQLSGALLDYGLQKIHIVKSAVWTETTNLSFRSGDRPEAGSLVHKSGAKGAILRVPAIDIVEWMRLNLKEDDYIYIKMDIEGAEYPVLMHLMRSGLVCWVDKWALEWHRNLRVHKQTSSKYYQAKWYFLRIVALSGMELASLE